MIEFRNGDLLKADTEALVNTVNTVGIMGKGIALQFRQAFPDNYKAYRKACQSDQVKLGKMFVFHTGKLTFPKIIINFPTKADWRSNSRLADIESGLVDLVNIITSEKINSIAIPPLGCGNGGLDWQVVRPMIVEAFSSLPQCSVIIYAPGGLPEIDTMTIATKRPKMTKIRAALLCLMERYQIPDYELSMLEIQKLAYLLQTAGEPMRLEFEKQQYGPYNETLHHALQSMDGHYFTGYGDRNSRVAIKLMHNSIAEAEEYLKNYPETQERLSRVIKLIEGFETPYGIELLATVHWVGTENTESRHNPDAAISGVHSWNDHKRKTFKPEHIRIAWQRLKEQGWLNC